MLPSQLDRIDEAVIRTLPADGTPESQVLEFKRSLPSTDDKGRTELAKDVCALANADGGDIVFGVAEHDGTASDVHPITDVSADAAKRRITQVLDARLEPRVIGIQFQEIPLAEGRYVLVLRVPASFDGPHRYLTANQGDARFVARVGTLTSELTFPQLRTAFDRTATLTERARAFRLRRVEAITAGDTWKPLRVGPKCVVHLVPIAAMGGRTAIDVRALHNGNYMQFSAPDWHGGARNLNLEGLVIHPGLLRTQQPATYVQVFRTGAIEALRFAGRLVDDEKVIPSTTVSRYVRETVKKQLVALRSFGIGGPAVLGVSLLETPGYQFGVSGESLRDADRPDLILPETWINSIEAVTDIDSIIRPVLDVLWQCFDVESCYDYDEQGRWTAG